MTRAAGPTCPAASAVVRGGVVAYATELKAQLLGVDEALLARTRGPVDPAVSPDQLARGVPRARLGSDWGWARRASRAPTRRTATPSGRSSSPWRTVMRRSCVARPDRGPWSICLQSVAHALDLVAHVLAEAHRHRGRARHRQLRRRLAGGVRRLGAAVVGETGDSPTAGPPQSYRVVLPILRAQREGLGWRLGPYEPGCEASEGGVMILLLLRELGEPRSVSSDSPRDARSARLGRPLRVARRLPQ